MSYNALKTLFLSDLHQFESSFLVIKYRWFWGQNGVRIVPKIYGVTWMRNDKWCQVF